MSLSAKSATRTKAALRDRCINAEAIDEIRSYLEGRLDFSYWELSQDEANEIAQNRKDLRQSIGWGSPQDYQNAFESLMDFLRRQGKSAGARYIAARIFAGAEPDLYQLTQDWFAHRNIRRALSEEEMREIGATTAGLRFLGIQFGWEARAFYRLYREVRVTDRVWGSSCQVNHGKVKAIALTPNYNRLPLWVKKAMLNSSHWVETGDRIGNIWRLVDCAKAWKHAPSLPKGIAEKVGKMSIKSRMLAAWAWGKTGMYYNSTFRDMHQYDWNYYGEPVSRAEIVQSFWMELRRLQSMLLSALIAERHSDDCYYSSGFSPADHNTLRNLSEVILELPHSFLFEVWGRHKYASQQVYLDAIAEHGSPEKVCQNLFGNAGRRTVELFKSASQNAWRWASAVCNGNADAIQKVLGMNEIISFQADAIDFLKELPMQSRIRLLGATTFKYRGQINPISDYHVRDTGYLWKNIKQKPELGRIRC